MLDADALLQPISESEPSGEDLSFSTEFDHILESRRADDPNLEQGVWQTDIKAADWAGVRRNCSTLLKTRSKDLRLAAWLAESAARLDGFRGLATGFRVIEGLCDRYWEIVHPLPNDGDLEERIGNLSWLLANAQVWLREIPIVAAPQGRFCLNDFDYAQSHSSDSKRDPNRPGLELLEPARRDTPHDFYRTQIEALNDCSAALDALQAVVDMRLGMDGPSFTSTRDLLQHLQQTLHRFARDAGMLLSEHTDTAEAPTAPIEYERIETSSELPATAARGPAGFPASRKEALHQLRQVAEYFRRNEPHSPAAYLADKAARWADMPLHVWLKRVIKDNGTLEQMEEMLDVNEFSEGR